MTKKIDNAKKAISCTKNKTGGCVNNDKPRFKVNPKKIALISKDKCKRIDSVELSKIIAFCDEKKCDTVLFAPWTVKKSMDLSKASLFNNAKNVKTVILEKTNSQCKNSITEIIRKNDFAELEQCFAYSKESVKTKRCFVDNFKSRCFGETFFLLCGELNITKTTNHKLPIKDDLHFYEKLCDNKINLILNPCHTYMVRPEMNMKRKDISKNKRLLVSVWNIGRKNNSKEGPWIAFRDKKNIIQKIIKSDFSLPNRNDVAIGILQVP